MPVGSRLVMIRHAPSLHGGRMAGRRDVGADLSDSAALAAIRARLGDGLEVVSSPALRCRETARALWPDTALRQDARLWEQDFGDWEGLAFADLPDLGPKDRAALAAHLPPGGESFAQVCARVQPALSELAQSGGAVAVVAHAGVIRAALALALDTVAGALAFEIAPLSVTDLRWLPGHGWSIACVNRGPE